MEQIVPTAMFGGSFDPVHLGHLHLVHTVLVATKYRRFVFVPVARNNFKQGTPPIASEHRLKMLRLGLAAYRDLYPDDPPCHLVVDDCEIRRGGISYTYDTVRHLYLAYGIKGRLGLVMGDDLLPGLAGWHAFDALKELVTFVVIRRRENVEPFGDVAVDIEYIDNALFDDSSSRIRRACAALKQGQKLGTDIRSLMCEEVADYVEQHGLYRSR